MDAKITKKRLGDYLSYEWLRVVAFALIIIVVWSVVFSVTSTKLTADQLFTVFNYTGTTVGTDYDKYSNLLIGQKALSYEVNEISTVDVTVNNGSMSGSLLDTRMMTGEGDVMFAADALHEGSLKYSLDANNQFIPKLDEHGQPVLANGEVVYETETSTYLYDFLSSKYYGAVLPLEDITVDFGYGVQKTEGILTVVGNYLANYFVRDGKTFDEAPMDEAKMEEDFRARVAETGDKRFRNEALVQSGLVQEKERLQQYREAYNNFVENLDAGKITATESTLILENDAGQPLILTGKFSVNLNPNGKMNALDASVYYYKKDADNKNVKTTENINLLFLNLVGSRKEFIGEKLMFVDFLMDRYYKD